VSYKRARFFTAVAVLCLSGSTWGQDSQAESVKGELHSSSLMRAEVTLTDLHGGRSVADVQVGGDGRFEFRHVPYGEYRLTVLDASEQAIHQELIDIHQQRQPIEVNVMMRDEPRPASGSISVRELLHPPAKKAFKAFVAAEKFSESGEHKRAAEQLEKAVELSPDYAAAWVNLGAQHIFLKHFEEALLDLTRATEIAGPTPMILGNMAYAQYALRRFAEGTRSLREALRLDPESAPAHYLLGGFLVRDARTRAEGVQHLETAARVMPAARAELERIEHESVQVVTHP
jgi:tetratricopeptide (TPR) repeat protein